MHVLFTFLGVYRKQATDGKGGYPSSRYEFPGGWISEETNFFPRALLDHLRRTGKAPDKLVMLGTSGSMWDAVALGLGAPASGAVTDLNADFLGRLRTAALANKVGTDEVAEIGRVLSRRLNVPVEAKIIPYARTQAEATSIVEAIVDRLADSGDRLSCDVTHGFRHLPMLALAACAIAETLRDATVEAIWYGAHEMSPKDNAGKIIGPAPVLPLDGYLDLLRWVRALSVFDVTGDLRGLKQPLPNDLGPVLEAVGVRERLLRTEDALRYIGSARANLKTATGLVPFFKGALEQRLSWAEAPIKWRRQLALASQHRANGDLTLAILLLHEAALSRFLQAHPELENRSDFKMGPKHFASETLARGDGFGPVRRAFSDLRRLRNIFAHADEGEIRDPQLRQAIEDPARLRRVFDDLRSRLFDEKAEWP